MSTISDSTAQVVTPTVRAAGPIPQSASADPKKMVVRSSTHPLPSNGTTAPGKRKAEAELYRPIEKVQKKEILPPNRNSISTAPDRAAKSEKPVLSISSASTGPYRGTSKPSPVTQLSAEGKAPPKKGSFAEIMARGKPTIPPVGVITHKPKEKISSKKELELQKRELTLKGKPGGKISKSAPGSKRNSPGPINRVDSSGPAGKSLKPVGYQGTSKAKPQPSYKGTMKPISPTATPVSKKNYNSDDHGRRKSLPGPRHKETYSDEESELEEAESYVFEEDYSDMEAGFEDVEDEDERATRLAKKEDDYEQMMLDELKRQKEAKRMRLAALAEKARRR